MPSVTGTKSAKSKPEKDTPKAPSNGKSETAPASKASPKKSPSAKSEADKPAKPAASETPKDAPPASKPSEAPPSAEPSKAKHKAPPTATKREIRYKEHTVVLYQGNKPLTAAIAKTLLGLGPAHAGAKDRVFTVAGEKVFLANNANRPLRSIAHIVEQIMRRAWFLNGETIVIGETGIVLDGQHRLLGLIEALFDYEKHPGKWKDHGWMTPPTLDAVVVFGVSEDRKVVHTLNTGYVRSLADVIFMEDTFKKFKGPQKKALAGVLQKAVQFVWRRTSAKEFADEAKFRSHLESMEYIQRHRKLIEAARHVYEENSGDEESPNRLTAKYGLNLGMCAGLLYLMGSSATDPVVTSEDKHYFNIEPANEKNLDWSLWDDALAFWTSLASAKAEVKPVLNALAKFDDGGTQDVRLGTLIQAWLCYANDETLTPKSLSLEFEDGVLVNVPSCGGIDLVGASRFEADEEEEETAEE